MDLVRGVRLVDVWLHFENVMDWIFLFWKDFLMVWTGCFNRIGYDMMYGADYIFNSLFKFRSQDYVLDVFMECLVASKL